MTFAEGEDATQRIGELAANTLAHHLAVDETRPRLIEVFRAIGASIAANTDGDQRALIRRSPLPPAAVAELRVWLTDNMVGLQTAAAEDRLFDEIVPVVLRFATSRAISAISVQEIIPRLLMDWIDGRPFVTIFAALAKVDARVSGDRVTVEDAVALCESGFGYDVAMVAASIADLTEGMGEALHSAAALLQRQIKNGLTSRSALAFHEAGFADRHIATVLGAIWVNVEDRADVRAACQQQDAMQAVLSTLPTYFTLVAAELGRWA